MQETGIICFICMKVSFLVTACINFHNNQLDDFPFPNCVLFDLDPESFNSQVSLDCISVLLSMALHTFQTTLFAVSN